MRRISRMRLTAIQLKGRITSRRLFTTTDPRDVTNNLIIATGLINIATDHIITFLTIPFRIIEEVTM